MALQRALAILFARDTVQLFTVAVVEKGPFPPAHIKKLMPAAVAKGFRRELV